MESLPKMYVSWYKCPECGYQWVEMNGSACNAKCPIIRPHCNFCGELTPISFIEVDPEKPITKTFIAQRYDCEGEEYGLYEVPETLRNIYEKLFNDLLNNLEQDEDLLEEELEKLGITRVFADRFDA